MVSRAGVVICLIAAVVSGAVAPARSREDRASEALLFDDGAILAEGPEKDVRDLHAAAEREGLKGRSYAEALRELRTRYGETVELTGYLKFGGVQESGARDPFEMPLRAAVLKGWIPPIEGLEEAQALRVLSRLGIFAMTREAFDRIDTRERLAALLASVEGDLLVLGGTGPRSPVVQYKKDSRPSGTAETEAQ